MIISKPLNKIYNVFDICIYSLTCKFHKYGGENLLKIRNMYQLFHMEVDLISIRSTLCKRVNILYRTHVIPPLKRISHDINCVLLITFRPHSFLLCGDCL